MDKAGDLLQNMPIFRKAGESGAADYSGVFDSWSKIVGPKLGQYSRVMDIEHNSLLVEVDHPAIIQLLQMKYRFILNGIHRKYPQLKIADMRMILKNPEYAKQREAKKSSGFPGDDHNSEVPEKKDVDISSIDNDKFRELLLDMKKRSQV